jgi:putative DNA primase/helicase
MATHSAHHENVLLWFEGVKVCGDQHVAHCPCGGNHAHDDRNHSLTIGLGDDGRVLLKCFAGCPVAEICAAVGKTEADLYPDREERQPLRVSVSLLAWDKKIPTDFLLSCGVTNLENGTGVAMPYRDASGKKLFVRKRTALRAKQGTHQPKGVPLQVYGAERLGAAKAAGRLTFVEGESDCWTLWFHDVPALGIPGASAVQTVTEEHLAGLKEVFVWQEPGEAGQGFVNRLARRLAELGFAGEAKVTSSAAHKDPNALHQRDPEGFKSAWEQILASAKPIADATTKRGGARTGSGRPRQPREARVPGVVSQPPTPPELAPPPIPPPAPGYYSLTDCGNAQRLAFRHGKDLHYVRDWKKWLVWDTTRWVRDGDVVAWMKDTACAIYTEADAADNADLRRDLRLHAQRSESHRAIHAAINLAESEPGIPLPAEAFDDKSWLLNVSNGTLDLRSGTLRPPAREDLLTRKVPIAYDPDAQYPYWNAFLRRVMDGSAEMLNFLRRAVGYSLTGDVREECLFFLYGLGANGKSTFVEIVSELTAGYSTKATAETILASKYGNQIPNDVARLDKARFVSVAELPEDQALNESRIKDMTGRDTMTARFLGCEFFQFYPIFKLWMYGNHKPFIRGSDEGMWRRVRLIPFSVTIPREERDPALREKLRAELPGILRWAVEGCLLWQRSGLPMPEAVREATEEYRTEMDLLADFFEERCVTGNPTKISCTTTALYAAYTAWCKERGEQPMSQTKLGMKLKSRGYTQSRTTQGLRCWRGISLSAFDAGPDANGYHAASGPTDLSRFDR